MRPADLQLRRKQRHAAIAMLAVLEANIIRDSVAAVMMRPDSIG